MKRNRLLSAFSCLALAVSLVPEATSSAARADAPTLARVQSFLKRHCYDCHGPQRQQARTRFDQIAGFSSEQQELWTKVHKKLADGEMPPEERPQPTAAEKEFVLDWIERQSAAAEAGSGSVRRLNRRELSAALRDLTGLSVDFARALPEDGKIAGFDTGAAGLQDAADSVAQIMEATRRAVDGIRFLEGGPGHVLVQDFRDLQDLRRDAFKGWENHGAEGRIKGVGKPGVGALLDPKWLGERRGGSTFDIPSPADGRGIIRLKLLISAMKTMDRLPNPHLCVEFGGVDFDYHEITATPEQPQELVYEVQIDDLPVESDGLRITLTNRVELPYAIDGFENEEKSKPEDNIPGGTGLFRPDFDKKSLAVEKQPVPWVVLHRIEIDPDYVAAWPPAGRETDLGQLGDNPENARRLLSLWIERAWRRPVSEADQERFLQLYRTLREQEFSFDDALRAAFQSVLLSGQFRYLSSPADSDPVVGQHAIASRLSFMLWGTPPDAELRRLAAEGRLRDPAVLDAQVDRLLDDPQSVAFFRPFVTQWLEIGQPITIAMDHFKQQDFRFARYLKDSMRRETVAYVQELFVENRSAGELIDSGWTMMNDILAHHYGYDGVEGGHLRKVKLREADPRGGGILGHAGIQSMLCWMGENWVIYRGAWTLRHILDDPPPPPPLEVPELVPSDGQNHGKTFRELLKQHQQDNRCSVCHKSIDPLGFAFQNFDISGRWREVEYERYTMSELDGKIEWRGAGESRPVDAAGQLPRGEEFESFVQCKELIVEHYLTDVVRGLTKKLFLYGTGRRPNLDEMAEIRTILEEHAPEGYPIRDLLKAVVRSDAFLNH